MIRNYEPTFDAVDRDLTHYRGVIVGTGYYEGGFFLVEIFLDRTFPYTPPRVIWHMRIWKLIGNRKYFPTAWRTIL